MFRAPQDSGNRIATGGAGTHTQTMTNQNDNRRDKREPYSRTSARAGGTPTSTAPTSSVDSSAAIIAATTSATVDSSPATSCDTTSVSVDCSGGGF